MAQEDVSRQDEILAAAQQEFINEGFSGARLQGIADNIGVTKAMIHYYFDTKDNLFAEVYRDASQKLISGLMDTLEESTPLFQKIEEFIDQAINRFNEHDELVGFVVNELDRHPEKTTDIFRAARAYDSSIFDEQLEEAASNYEIAPAQSNQVVANMLSLCLFPFIGKSFLKEILGSQGEDTYEQFLKQRREVIKDTIINSLAS